MKLSKTDADTFYRLMWALQHFVNTKLRIVPEANSVLEYAQCTMEDKLKVREALLEDKKLIEEFVRAVPQGFSDDELAIISGWRHCVSGRFYIERFLKKYAIFILGNDVYGVSGISESFSEIIHPSHLPLFVNAVLLPFKGRIIYDGIFEPYTVMFGRNITSELKDTYMTAKSEKRIIETIPT
ncbi:MAG: hypothetical protein EAZ74_00635 [Alphaproteobacteria bacterium]|nr:MAG: hypothetical protein EAY76_01315 [Alphaproteobacteria bacterium]TAF15940.1 MAG: hypothetical protein EAZ74_00635 [Alphaproteobacteria bacterium]TAF41943.1 MAG: hypothetical protein EAZ66_00515 [Alphaproteobacteria bacterium]TAF76754.1 MAG: hypothetical protein EAZ52_03090 [Alphaproteobacteria bacterium]